MKKILFFRKKSKRSSMNMTIQIISNIKRLSFFAISLLTCITMNAKEYHVSTKGDDANTGSFTKSFKTINAAAQVAFAGDTITVHSGEYREWVNPPRGGQSEQKPIVYRAAPHETVYIKGSERIKNWTKVGNGIWKVVLPNTFFANYNPYADRIRGDWFEDHGNKHHTGEVFLNNKSLYEVFSLSTLEKPEETLRNRDTVGVKYVWYCQSDSLNTVIWANFRKYDPNKELVEISTRRTCFYPEKPNLNYITISGFTFTQAATQWAAPTAEQIGMIATHWNKGWIIENNVIQNSKCVGITLGKERGTGHNLWLDEPDKDGTIHYIEVVFRTLKNGWNKEMIGSHIVRNNTISDCEQAGICGSMGGAFSQIYDNHIYNINAKAQFSGWEMGGIKLHGAIDTQIAHNLIHDCVRGIWLDWMSQGTRVTRNLMYRNGWDDILMEVNNGPYIIDNNVFMSQVNIIDWSQGGAFINNTFLGDIPNESQSRFTPYHVPHSTEIVGFAPIAFNDERFYNNIFVKSGLERYDGSNLIATGGNVYYGTAKPKKDEVAAYANADFDPLISVIECGSEVYLKLSLDPGFKQIKSQIISSAILGKTKISKCAFENPDGTPFLIDMDIVGNRRGDNPTPGAIETLEVGDNYIKIW